MKKKIITATVITASIVCAFLLGKSQAKTEIIEIIPNGYINTNSEEFFENYIDMRTVIDFETSETGLQLYTNDGNGYYWER